MENNKRHIKIPTNNMNNFLLFFISTPLLFLFILTYVIFKSKRWILKKGICEVKDKVKKEKTKVNKKEKVKLNSEKIRDRDKKIEVIKTGLLIMTLFLIVVYFLLVSFYEGGNFTISLDPDFAQKSGLVIYENNSEDDKRILKADRYPVYKVDIQKQSQSFSYGKDIIETINPKEKEPLILKTTSKSFGVGKGFQALASYIKEKDREK